MAADLILCLLFFIMNFGLIATTFQQTALGKATETGHSKIRFLAISLLCYLIFVSTLLYLTDLEADHLNPFEAAAFINKWVLPEFVLQGVLCVLFLLTGHWVMFLLAAPVTCYHVMLFMKRQHLIDVTEVFRSLDFEKKYRLVKLGFYLLFFAILAFRLVLIVFEILRNDDDDIHFS